ncbi:MAG: hypothetical protein GTO14_22925 [Anaerolineales bacterium]|nr:hypothetical protein [Anaerolineales bacterium]
MHRFRPIHKSVPAAPPISTNGARGLLITFGLALINQVMNVGATTGFATSGRSETPEVSCSGKSSEVSSV